VSLYIDQFFVYVITVSQYLLPHRIKFFCKISGIVKLLKVFLILQKILYYEVTNTDSLL
jgi:hypothetical protein